MLAPNYTAAPPSGIGLVTVTLANSLTAAAPTINYLACWDNAGAVTACSGTYTQVVGVAYKAITVTGGTSTYNYTEVVRMGTAPCSFSGSASVGHYVISGSSGQCVDDGATYPTSAQPVGVVLTGGGSGTYPIFAMNDLPTPGSAFAGLATANSFTMAQTFSGATSFSSAPTLNIPLPSTAPTMDGQIAYNVAGERYEFGETALAEDVYPVVLLPNTIVPTSPNLICSEGYASGGPTGCQNANDTGYSQVVFSAGEFSIPANYLVLGKTLRLTMLLYMNATYPTTVPFKFTLLLLGGTNVGLYLSQAITPTAAVSGETFQVVCTISTSGTETAMAGGGAMVAGCRPDVPFGSTTTEANVLTQPVEIDTTSTHSVAFGLAYGGATAVAGNTMQLLSSTMEVLQSGAYSQLPRSRSSPLRAFYPAKPQTCRSRGLRSRMNVGGSRHSWVQITWSKQPTDSAARASFRLHRFRSRQLPSRSRLLRERRRVMGLPLATRSR